MRCNLCPRQCGALRTETAGEGRCRMPGVPVVAPGEVISEKELAYLKEIGYNNDLVPVVEH